MSGSFTTSYSHTCEDVLLRRAFPDLEDGFFIDVGAYDPIDDSVTKLFYDLGWSGINVEPNPRFYERLKEHRSRDITLAAAVSTMEGPITLNVIGDTGLTTVNSEIAQAHSADGFATEEIQVPTQTLEALWNEHVPEGQAVHFLKIDVEGAEADVIQSANWSKHRPWVLVVEATLPNTTTPNHQEWDHILIDAGYLYCHFDGVNRYYVAQEHSELKDVFSYPLNVVLDRYTPFMAYLEQCTTKSVEARLVQSEKEFAACRHELEACRHELEACKRELDRAEQSLRTRPRPVWERILFKETGRPRKLVHSVLFHSNGKPRGMFRRFILRRDGTPRSVLHLWMRSSDYQTLQSAVRLSET